MAMAIARIDMPEFGHIVGGRLRGWHYKFLHYVPLVDEAKLCARVTPPHWPFPRDMVLESDDWVWFRPTKDSKQLDGDKLIFDEYRAFGLKVPVYLRDGSLRLQQLVKADEKKRKVKST